MERENQDKYVQKFFDKILGEKNCQKVVVAYQLQKEPYKHKFESEKM